MIYLDNAATTIVYDEVVEKMVDVYKNYNFNPSSGYRQGLESEKIIKNSRNIISEIINSNPDEIIFNSGGSEGNNLIKSIAYSNKNKGRKIITSNIEHDSVYETINHLKDDFEIEYVDFNKYGEINLEKIEKMITKDTILVSLMHINNEVGTINPIEKIGEIIKRNNFMTYFHVDCVQSFMKLDLDMKGKYKDIDIITASAHKIHGPKGVGFTYIKKNTKISPLIHGGGQEYNLRSGTENVAGIAGFGKACEIQKDDYVEKYIKLANKKTYLEEKITKKIPDVKINSHHKGASHILNVSFLGVKGEILLHSLEMDDILVSTGSACSSKKRESRVLKNLELPKEYRESAIRFSLSDDIEYDDLDFVVEKLKEKIEQIRQISNYKIRG